MTGRRAPETLQSDPEAGAGLVVRTTDLRKVYETGALRTEALRGVDLRIRHGERVAIMGPSGCGKTTLLNCLSGLEPPSSGTVEIDGTDLYAGSDDDRTRFRARRMGFIFQSFNLLPVLTAVENVELPLLVTGNRPRVARDKALDALGLVGLDHRAHHRPREMSGGEQQRVAIARSLVHDPPLVWADEPTGNLDSETSKAVMDLIVRLNEETGKTFVVVTHDPNVAARCHRTIHMESGRVRAGTDPDASRPEPEQGPHGRKGMLRTPRAKAKKTETPREAATPKKDRATRQKTAGRARTKKGD